MVRSLAAISMRSHYTVDAHKVVSCNRKVAEPRAVKQNSKLTTAYLRGGEIVIATSHFSGVASIDSVARNA